jgi:2-polyprenyl-3-methyl-5-hydroxy-6-metoxy-1,4-benzoquinol methylase
MLSDANAVLIDGRVLVQHQAALSLIRTWTQDPAIPRIRWLDLACGRGQILSNLDHVIPEKRREKIEYRGFDVSKECALQTERQARSLFKNASVNICELQFFETFLAGEESFDIVTCTNAVHDISPEALAETFVGAICRTGSQGCLYLYDTERLRHG